MTVATSGWGAGYVTDIAYVPGYYPNQSPLHLELACLLGGVAGIEVAAGRPLSYLELGCGHGFGALALAASNPAWRITGVDFNPTHIAAARELAGAAGIDNATFIEADLATLVRQPREREVPEADIVTMHGLWSWVGDDVRAGVVALLAEKVRAGGVVQLSYNALPTWQGALGMQRLLREAGQRLATRSDRQAEAGADFVRALAEAGALHLSSSTFVTRLLEHLGHAHPTYLAHEYMAAAWRPTFHADVVAALADAKLSWVASAQLIENFPSLMLGKETQQLVDRFDDPVMRELIRDMCVERPLRQDVFVRGPRRLSPEERDDALKEVTLALLRSPKDFCWEVDAPAGKANLGPDFFRPIVEALWTGPRRVGDLLAMPELPRHDNPAEVVGMLVGTSQAIRVLGPGTEPEERVRRLNAAAARRFARGDNLNTAMALATSGIGAPLSCPMLDLFVAAQLQAGVAPDPRGWAGRLAAGHPPEEQQGLSEFIETLLAERTPVWRRVGVLSPDAAGAM